jgi:hypothetical protein
MAWIAPMTAIAGSVFTAAQFNTFVRDLLNECPTAKATTPGSHFVASGTNQVVERIPAQASVNVSESTASTTYVNLTTSGPSVTCTTGTSALIVVSAEIHNATASEAGKVGIDISGATTEAPDVNYSLRQESSGTGEFQQCSLARLHTALTPGSNTFKMMYQASGGTASFNFRNIIVIPY